MRPVGKLGLGETVELASLGDTFADADRLFRQVTSRCGSTQMLSAAVEGYCLSLLGQFGHCHHPTVG